MTDEKIYSRIRGIGSYLPKKVVTNHDLEKQMETSHDWIVQRTGIIQRRFAEDSESTSSLGLKAAVKAISDAKIEKEEIDFIIFATLSPDHYFPGCGVMLQDKLGISKNIGALDIRTQCTGFVYGLSIADQFIKTGKYKNILLVGAEVQSCALDLTTRGRDMGVLFGDGAGAAVISATKNPRDGEIISTQLFSEGKYAEQLMISAPGTAHRPFNHPKQYDDAIVFPSIDGRLVFKHAVTRMEEAIKAGLSESKISFSDIDLFIFHQANIRIVEMIASKMGIPPEKMFNNIQNVGNTTAASIPIAMDEAYGKGILKKGNLVCISAFGSGFTWGSAIIRF